MQDTVCIILLVASPILSAILLFNQLKFQKHETQKRKKQKEKVLHRKPRRNKAVKEGESPLPFRDQELPFTNDTTNN